MSVIGIIGAMDEEVRQLKEKMTDVIVKTKVQMDFYRGTLNGAEVVVVRSGIGKVNAGVCAQVLIDDFAVDVLINTGIAGSLNADINIGDVVVSSDVVQHDMDAVAFGYEKGQIPQMAVKTFESDEKLRLLAIQSCRQVNPEIGVFCGRIATGDQFIASKERKEQIAQDFGAYCTEMEGGAIAQVAYLNQIPFVILRAISDKADDSAQVDYPTFEKQAILHSVRLVEEMLKAQ